MFFVSFCICICPIHWSQVLSREWRCSWSSASRRCSNYIWLIKNFIAHEGGFFIIYLTVYLIIETHSYWNGPLVCLFGLWAMFFTNPEVNWNEVLYMLSPWIFYHQFDLVCRIIWIKPLLSTYITNIYKNNKRLMVLPILYNSREYLPKKERRMWWNTYPAIRIHVRVSSLTYKNFVMDLFL